MNEKLYTGKQVKQMLKEQEDEWWQSAKILWNRLDSWQKEWENEKPTERKLIHEDTLALILWKIEKQKEIALKEQKEKIVEGVREKQEFYEKMRTENLERDNMMIAYHADSCSRAMYEVKNLIKNIGTTAVFQTKEEAENALAKIKEVLAGL